MTTPTRLRFSDQLVQVSPPWLRRAVSAPVLRGLLDPIDDMVETSVEAVRARFPGVVATALPSIGRDRKIVRGLDEPDATYQARLLRWWQDHKRRGGPYAMLRQLEAYYASDPRQIDLVYHSGTRYTLDPTVLDADGLGTITRDSITWRTGSDPTRWSLAWVFIHYPSGPTVLYPEAQSVLAIVHDWTPAHVDMACPHGVYPDGGGVWDYPEGIQWGDLDTVLWDSEQAVDFCAVTDDLGYLIADGDYVTADGDRIIV
jgi:hypothetical protein